MGVIRPQNGSILQPGIMHRWNWGVPTHAFLIYISSNRKKIFLILCSFIMGTWMGSSFPYSEQTRHGPNRCSEDNNSTSLPKLSSYPQSNNSADNKTNNAQILTTVSRRSASEKYYSNSASFNISVDSTTNTSSNLMLPNGTGPVYSNISFNDSHASNGTVNDDISATSSDFYHELKTTFEPWRNNTPLTLASETEKYLVESPVCKIPYFHPRDPSVQHAIRKVEPLSCGKQPLLFMSDNFLQINESNIGEYGAANLSMVTCCYHVLRRPESHDDDKVEISNDCIKFFNKTYIEDEYIKVKCEINITNDTREDNMFTDFYFTIPLKPEVEKRCGKMNFTVDSQVKSDPFSVMLLGLDAVSRLNFQRHLIKTRKVLLENLDAVEMFGYNKVGDNTFPNIVPLFSGMSEQELTASCWKEQNQPFDDCPWIWKSFAQVGYRTLYGEDSTKIACFNYLKEGFHSQPTDYYLRPFFRLAEVTIGWKKYLNTQLCLGSRPYHEITMKWARQIMQTFAEKFYFGFVWSNSLTHDDVNFVQVADNFLSTMLNELHLDGHLNNTILIVLSDHGMRWGSLRETSIGRYEERLPALYISVPRRFRENFPEMYEMLRVNSRRLTSPYDLYKSLLTILKLNPSYEATDAPRTNLGLSLFEEIPPNRTCEDAGINAHWCSCEEMVYLDTKAAEVISIAEFIAEAVNNITSEVRDKCAPFHLLTVTNAQRTTNVIMHVGTKDEFFYDVILRVTPGDALFEATVLASDQSEFRELQGEISRLNLYGNQSLCISETHLKKFCYCRFVLENSTADQGVKS